MGDYLMIILGTALVNNVVLVRFLGLCPFMGVSNKLDSALGMGLATTFVLTLAAVASWRRSTRTTRVASGSWMFWRKCRSVTSGSITPTAYSGLQLRGVRRRRVIIPMQLKFRRG